ncbi:hypothetical protein Poli38472_007253 [Pythium oligandrum]|uniref:NADP-dependent oxidoreductase domain-containing protein n=1 Tax=Pythium oligandrum TaxID=41045 RepID=A0A8K1CAF8_PYTOL|nr:hypothetical protein Poli38472_007253 [Pythium oligandrum]|eukprot:TMW59108.1 hypothetical protein Poli38472_007253 [Pythium oligandrum]
MTTIAPVNNMKYRLLGNTGLLVSRFSYGCFMMMERALTFDQSLAVLERAYQHGVNFFDNAEAYAGGHSEVILGQVVNAGIERGTWTREDLVISGKIFLGTNPAGPNELNKQGLSRKHIVEGVKATLKRLNLEYIDLVFCHRPDPATPIEETVRAMNFAIEQGWAFYWGTSEWSSHDIKEACDIADRLGLIRPAFDQCQYNIFERSRVEYQFVDLYKKYSYGLTTFSPIDGGILSGKFSKGIPKESRFAQNAFYQHLGDVIAQKAIKVAELEDVAKGVGCSMAQLALAWCASNENVSSVLFSATTVEQLDENMKALEFIDKITPEIKAKIDAVVQFQPQVLPQYGMMEMMMRGKYL